MGLGGPGHVGPGKWIIITQLCDPRAGREIGHVDEVFA